MSVSSVLALETVRTFGDGSLFTLENGALAVAGLNVILNSIVLATFLIGTIAVVFGGGNLGCSGPMGCLPPPEVILVGGLSTVVSGSVIYLNVRLYSAVQEKDEEFVYLWLKIYSGLTLLKLFVTPNPGFIVPDLLELWLVHAYQQSQEIGKLKAMKISSVVPKASVNNTNTTG